MTCKHYRCHLNVNVIHARRDIAGLARAMSRSAQPTERHLSLLTEARQALIEACAAADDHLANCAECNVTDGGGAA